MTGYDPLRDCWRCGDAAEGVAYRYAVTYRATGITKRRRFCSVACAERHAETHDAEVTRA